MSQQIPPPRIRHETLADHRATHGVLIAAFPTPLEANLVAALRKSGHLRVSLVAVENGVVVGHVAFSLVSTEKPTSVPGAALAPVAVHPAFERRGIGSSLIRHGLQACRENGFGWAVVLGDPGYYQRFGFESASRFGLANVYGVDEEFMALELRPACMPVNCGLVQYAPQFAMCGSVQ